MDDDITISKGNTVSIDYVLTVNGEEVDASRPGEPLTFVQGRREIIIGLERELYGMGIGDSTLVEVSANDGYGISDPKKVENVPPERLPQHIPQTVGTMVTMAGSDGRPQLGRIVAVTPESVQIDFNHPLAGKTLWFKVTIVDIKP